MGRGPTKHWVGNAFIKSKEDGKITDKVSCKYCDKTFAANVTRQSDHLEKCENYYIYMCDHGCSNESTRIFERHNPDKIRDRPEGLRQTTIKPIPKPDVSPDHVIAKFIFGGARPFTLFEGKDTDAVIEAIRNAPRSWKPPGRKDIGDSLLQGVFEEVREKVLAHVKQAQYLNFTVDETTDANQTRIVNLSLITERGAFLLYTDPVPLDGGTAQWLKEWVLARWQELLGGKLNRVNSITTDTCSTMGAFWSLLNSEPRTAHVFTVPCDSHGLQLLVKDILSTEPFKSLLSKAQRIVSKFRSSPKQLHFLREKNKDDKNRRALVMSVITRWGTQLRLIESVLKNREPFILYALDPKAEFKKDMKELLMDESFYEELGKLKELLQPVDCAVRQSEAERASLCDVSDRWGKIWTSLQSIGRSWPEVAPLTAENSPFFRRLKRQVKPIHWAAWVLDSSKTGKSPESLFSLNDTRWDMVLDFVKTAVTPSTDDARGRITSQFLLYCSRTEHFGPHSPGWDCSSNKDFWLYHQFKAPELSRLALRLMHSVANSVPSERAFSINGLVHSKVRSRLLQKKVFWQTYIYVNTRTLRRIEGEDIGPVRELDMSEDEARDKEHKAMLNAIEEQMALGIDSEDETSGDEL